MPTFANRVDVPYRPDQLFDLVADVDKYPEFLPWCGAAAIAAKRLVKARHIKMEKCLCI